MRLENSNVKSRRAFTLMEMVVVIVIIGIMTAMISLANSATKNHGIRVKNLFIE